MIKFFDLYKDRAYGIIHTIQYTKATKNRMKVTYDLTKGQRGDKETATKSYVFLQSNPQEMSP